MFTKPMFDQEIHFNNGSKRIIKNIVYGEQGNWFHFMDKDGVEHIVNPANVLFVRVWKSKNNEKNLNPNPYEKEKK